MSILVEHAKAELIRTRPLGEEHNEVLDARDHAIVSIVQAIADGEHYGEAGDHLLSMVAKLIRRESLDMPED